METIYSKYSRERASQYQIKTSILILDESRYVTKAALTYSAEEHIKQIYLNFETLRHVYGDDNIVKPISFESGSISFEYIDGESISQLLLWSVIRKDKVKFFGVLDMFIRLIDNLNSEYYCQFEHTPNFIDTFGYREKLLGLKSLTISNIDLIFENLLLDKNGQIKIVDYEWVFDYPIPLNFIKFRAINTFYYSNYNTIRNFVAIDELFDYLGILREEISEYIEMSNIFADIVGTERESAFIKKYQKKKVPFSFIEPPEKKAQLFYAGEGEGQFSEENSIFCSVTKSDNKIHFDLSGTEGITNIRFDPMEAMGSLYIKKVTLKDVDDKELLLNPVYSNAEYIFNGYYIFLEDDPQIYYRIDCKTYKSFEVDIDYFDEVPNNFLYEICKYRALLHNENCNLKTSIQSQEKLIEDLKTSVESQEKLIEDLKNQNYQKEEEVRIIKQRYLSANLEIDCKNQNINMLQKQIEDQIIELKKQEGALTEIFSTRWWRTRTLFLGLFNRFVLRKK